MKIKFKRMITLLLCIAIIINSIDMYAYAAEIESEAYGVVQENNTEQEIPAESGTAIATTQQTISEQATTVTSETEITQEATTQEATTQEPTTEENKTEETDSEAETAEIPTQESEKSNVIEITGFENYDGSKPYAIYEVEYGCSLEKLPLPSILNAYVEDGIKEVPITWKCVDKNMEIVAYEAEPEDVSTVYRFMAFLPKGYVLKPENVGTIMPYIEIKFAMQRMLQMRNAEKLDLSAMYSSGYNQETTVLKLSGNVNMQITAGITGTTVEQPILQFEIPNNIELAYYPQKDDATLGPNLLQGDSIVIENKENGNKVLKYKLIANVAQVGFNITAKPNYKLKDASTQIITASYYDGETLLKEETISFIVDNPTVKVNGLTPMYTRTQTIVLNGNTSVYDIPLVQQISGTYQHYPYEKVKMTVPIPKEAVPGQGTGENFIAFNENTSYKILDKDINVTYKKSVSYSNISGSVKGTTDVLEFELTEGNTFLPNDSYIGLSNIVTLRFTNPEAKIYIADVSPKIEITVDGEERLILDYVTISFYKAYNIEIKNFALSDYFYHSKDQNALTNFVCNSWDSVLPLNNRIFNSILYNNTKDTFKNIRVEYLFDEKLYANKLEFTLSQTSDQLPKTVSISYKTKNGGDTLVQRTMNEDERIIQLDEGDAFIYAEVIYDKLGSNGVNNTLMSATLNNYEKLEETAGRAIKAKILSAESEKFGEIGEQSEILKNFKLKNKSTYGFRSYISPSTVNKGDSFTVEVDTDSGIEYKNIAIYFLMPKGYIFSDYIKPTTFVNAKYKISSRDVGDGNVLYAVEYTDDVNYSIYNESHYFVFRVGPEVDTSVVQMNIKMPLAIYVSSQHEVFGPIDYLIKTEEEIGFDVNGDGDKNDKYANVNTPQLTINSVNALTAQSYVSSNLSVGENIDNSYEFDSTGKYSFYLYNGFNSGNAVEDAEIIVPMPRKGQKVMYKENTYNSQWDVYLTGEVSTTGAFLENAMISYSVDGGSNYTNSVSDYKMVTHVKIVSAVGKKLINKDKATLEFPFTVSFVQGMDEKTVYKTYFGTQMKYHTTVQGSLDVVANIQPSILSSKNIDITGTIFKDFNGNGTRDVNEMNNNQIYTIELYKGEKAEGSYIQKSTSNRASGNFSIGVLMPGEYSLKVKKADNEYYGYSEFFDTNGVYTFKLEEKKERPVLNGLQIGILSPRTISTNLNSVVLIEGRDTRKIVPQITPALEEGETGVRYESSDTSVVSVTENGVLTFVGEGTAQISVIVPQISALVSQGSPAEVKNIVSVTCQKDGCQMKASPYTNLSSSNVLKIPIGGILTKSINYYYADDGYCNDASHEIIRKAVFEVTEDDGTNASFTLNGNYSSYQNATLSVPKPGNFKVKISREWGHDKNRLPQPLVYEVTALPYSITAPAFSVQPSVANGKNGWYTTLPTVMLTQTQSGTYTNTWFAQYRGTDFKKLTDSNKPSITSSGEHRFKAYSKTNTGTSSDVTSQTVESGIYKVDIDIPTVSGVSFEATGSSLLSKIGNFFTFGNFFKEGIRVKISAEDLTSGPAKLYYTLPQKTEQETSIRSGIGSFVIPLSTNGNVSFKVEDAAGNMTASETLKKEGEHGSTLWVIEDEGALIDEFSFSENGYIDANNQKWFADTVTVKTKVSDTKSGLQLVQIQEGSQTPETVFLEENLSGSSKTENVVIEKAISKEGTHQLKVIAIDNALNEVSKDVEVRVDKTEPSMEKTKESVEDNEIVTRVEIRDDGSGIDSNSITLSKNGEDIPFTLTKLEDGYEIAFSTQEMEKSKTPPVYEIYAEDYTQNSNHLTLESTISRYEISYKGGEHASGTPPKSNLLAEKQTFKLEENTFSRPRYLFAGWEASDGSGMHQPADMLEVARADIIFTAVFERDLQDVVYVSLNGDDNQGDGSNREPVKSLEEALASIKNGGKIILMDDYKGPLVINQEVVIDLNGHEISLQDAETVIQVKETGNLIIEDSGKTGKVTGDINTKAFSVEEGGKLNIKGGTILGGYECKGDISVNSDAIMLYQISYSGGEESSGTSPETCYVQEGTETILKENTFQREQFTFCGWEFEGKLYQEGEKIVMPGRDIVLKARWSIQDEVTDISGEVHFENGLMAENAKVKLEAKNGDIFNVKTDKDGQWKIQGVNNGSYTIDVIIEWPEGNTQNFSHVFAVADGTILSQDNKWIQTRQTNITIMIEKPDEVKLFEEKVALLPKEDAEDDEVLNAVNKIGEAKQSFDDLIKGYQKQTDEAVKEYLCQIINRLMNIKVVVESSKAGTKVEVFELESLAGYFIEKNDIDKSNTITIKMTVEKKAKSELGTEKVQIENVAGKNKTILFYDISVIKEIVEEGNIENISELPKPVSIKMDLLGEEQKGRDFKVLFYHDGKVREAPTYREENSICFEAQLFSTYGISYVPEAKETGNDTGKQNPPQIGILATVKESEVIKFLFAKEDEGELDKVPKTGDSSKQQNRGNQKLDIAIPEITRRKKKDAAEGIGAAK